MKGFAGDPVRERELARSAESLATSVALQAILKNSLWWRAGIFMPTPGKNFTPAGCHCQAFYLQGFDL